MLIVGNIALMSGVAVLLAYVAAGHQLTIRPFAALVAGPIIGALGYRLASGSFTGASQMPHFGTALGTFAFLASVPMALARGGHLPASERLLPCALFSVIIIASWYWRARRRKRRNTAGE